jgi:DNA-directed RNA polymerase specialized sigma24 family protein
MVWPIILEMKSFRVASYYGGTIRESTNGYSVKGWPFTILRNIWLNELRHQPAAPKIVELEADEKLDDVSAAKSGDRHHPAQSSMRHAKSGTMLDHYAQTDMDELIPAQELMLDAIFSHAERTVQ